MSTFAQLKSAVSKRLLDASNTAISSADVGDAINDSIAYWKLRRFGFNEARDTTQILTPQVGTLPLPTDFLLPSKDDAAFEVSYSNMRYVLRKVDAALYDDAWLGNGYGIPRYYARLANSSYQCYPLPDKAYNLITYYLKQYATLVNDTDTNDFTVTGGRLITLWTLKTLIMELRQDDKMVAYYDQAAKNEYRNLLVFSDKANASGSLTIHSALM